MPTIPSYERSQRATNSANFSKMSTDSTAQKLIAQTGEQIQKFTEKIDKINQFRIITESSLGLQRELNELKVAASEETDLVKKQQYINKVDDIVNKWNNSVSEYGNTETRSEFSRSSQFSGETSKLSIQNDYRKSVIQAAKDDLNLSVLNAIEKAKSLDSSSIIDANKLVDDSIKRAISVGSITSAQGEQIRSKAKKDVTMSYLYTVADDDPELAKSEIDSGEYSLDYEDKHNLNSFIKSKETELADRDELERLNNKIQTLTNIPADVSLRDVYRMETVGIIDSKTANNYKTRLIEGISVEPTESNSFVYDQLMNYKVELFDVNKSGKVSGAKGILFFKDYKRKSAEFVEKCLNAKLTSALTEDDFVRITKDVLALSSDKYDSSAQANIVAYKVVQKVLVMDNPLTALNKIPVIFNEIQDKVSDMSPIEAKKYAEEKAFEFIGRPKEQPGSSSSSAVGREDIKVGATFEGKTIKKVVWK